LLCCPQEAKAIGDEFLQLEKYVNLNYMGFHKVGWSTLAVLRVCLRVAAGCPLGA